MKHTIVATVFSGLLGAAALLVLLGAAGSAGAQSAPVPAAAPGVSRAATVSAGTPLTTTFTYQGQLKNGGAAVTGTCQMAFRLYDDPLGNGLVGSPITASVPVTNGLFTAGLDFGGSAFNGGGRWLEVQVDCGGGFATLAPRQAVTAVPYAIYAGSTGALQGFSVTTTAPSTGQVLKWSGSAWAPGLDNTGGGGGGITAVAAGPGLSGGGVTGAITLTVNFSGTGSASTAARSDHTHSGADITSGTIGDARIANTIARVSQITPTVWANAGMGSGLDADLLDGQDSRSFVNLTDEQIITAPKTFLHGLTFGDGTSQFTAFDGALPPAASYRSALPGPGTAATADNEPGEGTYASLGYGADGLGLVSYFDAAHQDLKVLHCGNAACSSGNLSTTVDSTSGAGATTSLAIGSDGLGLISYWDHVDGTLKVLHCGNVVCSSGNVSTTVDLPQPGNSHNTVGAYSAVTIGADGLGLISYYDYAAQAHLKVLHCGNLTCDSGNISTTVDFGLNVGDYTAITIGADGLGLISYYDETNGNLNVLHCGNAACTSGNTATVGDSANNVGPYAAITIGADELGLISYYDVTSGNLKVLHCGNIACDSGNTTTAVNITGDVGAYSSITIAADGLGLISYYDNSAHTLKVLHCGNPACNSSSNIITTVDSAGDVGQYSSIILGADGLGLISYVDLTNYTLKMFHCSNTQCGLARVGR